MNSVTILNSSVGNYIKSNGNKYSYFAGNNYLGLANHPVIKKASIRSIKMYGNNFSASRRTTGTADIHLELEKQLAAFMKKQDAVIFASGYMGNGILLEILKNRYSAVFIDELAHPSITGSIPRGIENIQYFNHCDASHLENLLGHHKGLNPLVITDGIFALTGEIAPLDKIYPLIEKHNAILVVDDAHSTGILGENGRGTAEHFNLDWAENIYTTGTMSKALGGYGGFISGTNELTNLIREKSATYQASTSLPPSIIATGIASLKIIQKNPGLRVSLLESAGELRKEIIGLGFQTTTDNTPIIPIMLTELSKAKDLSLFLENNGIIAPFMNYPVKLKGYMIRITVSASHTVDQIETLLKMLKKWRDKNGTN
ncbi:MAG: hypothetical protein A2W90_21765 [Bacteroidetes bacterium GWF2_42_66]|nr:MAG: hypothetical protein A2W92_04580 [Bacteroidetes bacterium GWA2_42_15]OFY03279.1 MAG: hypothetical protein A2W89_19095 [Bacteroidetes bacterium GWE2_42_39]OFY45671.1 MAG: hypothetical protein A2W90_21765 [Bacteroidetes bacterium GWF2_42_66]HBL77344.1 hypothetical protein [Prolixibacteraceae bacterium]HCU62502.1 hypothetical protein [Prolixibacteraceae bacterium]